MRPDIFFCPEAARRRREHLFGTAPEVHTWLLLEHPLPWSAKSFPDSRLSSEVRVHLARLIEQMRRCRPLMIRQRHFRREHMEFLAIGSGEHKTGGASWSLSSYED